MAGFACCGIWVEVDCGLKCVEPGACVDVISCVNVVGCVCGGGIVSVCVGVAGLVSFGS